MKIKLYKKTYRKTQEHDGTMVIQLSSLINSYLFNETSGKAFKSTTSYLKDDNGRTIGEETAKTLDVKAIKKEIPKCVKIKVNDLYIKI